jgi:hypothetical protein
MNILVSLVENFTTKAMVVVRENMIVATKPMTVATNAMVVAAFYLDIL